jgi:DNA-binding Xre family transcriptional regulator
MTMQLKGAKLLAMSEARNSHQLSLRAGVSHPTVSKYVLEPEKADYIKLSILEAILKRGCGLSPEQIREMRVGDLFDVT